MTRYSKFEKDFIADNCNKLTPVQIAQKLKGRSVNQIRCYMYNKKLGDPRKTRGGEGLSEEHKEFILNNYEKINRTTLAKQLCVPYQLVRLYFKENGLVPCHENSKYECRREVKNIYRPPDVYSNPNYQTMYL